MTIGQKFRPKMISAPKQPHAWAISLWCQWPLRKEKKRERKYIHTYILCLSWLTACNLLTWTMVRHRRVSSCLCMCACHYSSMRIAKLFATLFNSDSTFLISDGDIIAQRYLYFSMNQQICETDICVSLHNFRYQILSV